MGAQLLEHVDQLVIGGGALGTSIAYHLAQDGAEGSVQLIERFRLSEGTTWHSAGMVGQLRSKTPIMNVIQYSAKLYAEIEQSHPGLIAFKQTGSLRLATTPERLDEMTAQTAQASALGIDAQMIGPDQVVRLLPTMSADGIIGACWIPSDGYVDPEALAVGLGQLAAAHGVNVVEGVEVTGLEQGADGWVVTTDAGPVYARQVILACGMHTAVLAKRAGVFVPIVCSRQQLVASNPISPECAEYPTLREPEHSMIMRPKGDTLVIGSYAEDPEIELVERVPVQPRYTYEPEFARMRPVWEAANRRFPQIAEAGKDYTLKGPEGVTADGELIMGPSGLDGLWLAAGCSGHGIAAAGGIGWVMSEWIREGQPPIEVTDFALDRFPASYEQDADTLLAEARLHEIGHYAMVEGDK